MKVLAQQAMFCQRAHAVAGDIIIDHRWGERVICSRYDDDFDHTKAPSLLKVVL